MPASTVKSGDKVSSFAEWKLNMLRSAKRTIGRYDSTHAFEAAKPEPTLKGNEAPALSAELGERIEFPNNPGWLPVTAVFGERRRQGVPPDTVMS